MKVASLTVAAVCLSLMLGGCSKSAPDAVSVDGESLEKVREFKIPNGVKGVAYVSKGSKENPNQAQTQAGVMSADPSDMKTPEALHSYVMEVYGNKVRDPFFTMQTGTQACKVGRTPERTFLAVHLCEKHGGAVACAEIDTKLQTGCHMGDEDCLKQEGQQKCNEAIAARAGPLKKMLSDVLGK